MRNYYKHIGKAAGYLILSVNAFFTGIFILTAYSTYLQPEAHPMISCMGLAFPVFLVINLCFLIFWLLINYRYTLLPLFGFLICLPQIQTYCPIHSTNKTVPEGSIKVLSYNVMGFNGLKKEEGQNPILNYLAESNADIICMQEYGYSEKTKFLTDKDIKRALKAYPFHNIQIPNSETGSSKLACYSKFPILSAHRINYKSDYNGSVVYELKIKDDTVTLINNHLESNKLTKEDKVVYEEMLKKPKANKVRSGLRQLIKKLGEASILRSHQADAVAEVINKSEHSSIIVCGDFNDASISYTHRILTKNLDDAFTQSGKGLGISYNQNKFYFRIDNILISPDLKAYNCTVDRSIKDSDHYPIWCYISKR